MNMKLTKITAEGLEAKEIHVSSYAKDLLSKLTFEELDNEIDYTIVTVAELGFTKPATWLEIMKAGEKLGYEPCASMGANFPFETLEKGDWLYIAMEPITDSDGDPRVFVVERYGGGEQWLGTRWARPDFQWGLDGCIVFRLRKDALNSVPKASETALGHSDTLSLTRRVEALEAFHARVIELIPSLASLDEQ